MTKETTHTIAGSFVLFFLGMTCAMVVLEHFIAAVFLFMLCIVVSGFDNRIERTGV